MYRHSRRPSARRLRVLAVVLGLVAAAGGAMGTASAAEEAGPLAGIQKLITARGGDTGPDADDFVDIRQVPPNRSVRTAASFVDRCGKNDNHHLNSDNFIVTPGVDHGATHEHDYVGNRTTTARSTDRSLAAGGTTCANGDKSTFFWPVIRVQVLPDGRAQRQPGSDEGNVGKLIEPSDVVIRFSGSPVGKVRAMPRFLRSITGDAKAATNGPANARPTWTCTGFEDRITSKYPVCPQDSRVKRILEFPSCWDGKRTDSANHRTHIVFPKASGRCPRGTKAVPRLEYELTYPVPSGSVFAVDGFADQSHDPATDHADFENVMSASQMDTVVRCVNTGLTCPDAR